MIQVILTDANEIWRTTIVSYQTVPSLGGTAPAENSEKIYELKVHSHFKEVGQDSTEGIAGSSAVEIPKRKEFWEDLFIAQ